MTSRSKKHGPRGISTLSPLGAPLIVPSVSPNANAPSNRIGVGVIGTGARGLAILRRLLAHADAQVAVVCDVNRASKGYKDTTQCLGREPAHETVNEHYRKRIKSGCYSGCAACTDFRDVIARQDIDAVVVATPDHWHGVMTVMAARAGKDIYCETPLSLTVRQGQQMIEAVRANERILQTGSDQRSNPMARFACELIRNGRIGRVERVTSCIGPCDRAGPGPGWEAELVPDGFDYDAWLGPAPEAPYHRDRCLHGFRFNYDYAGGQVTNHGAHWADLAQWALAADDSGPVEIECESARFWPEGSLYNTATEATFHCRYANGVRLLFETNKTFAGARFEGTEGAVEIGCGGLTTRPTSLKSAQIGRDEVHLCRSKDHVTNFLDCVKSRKEPAAPVEIGHRAATICHLGNIAIRLWKDGKRKVLRWDPARERFTNDDEANAMLSRPMRRPWRV
jgi:predicted dehydrogenase